MPHLGGEVEQVPLVLALLESEEGLAVIDGVCQGGALVHDATNCVLLHHGPRALRSQPWGRACVAQILGMEFHAKC